MKETRDERDTRRRKPPLPVLPSVLMSANWSFVTQIGADEVQRQMAIQRQHAVSFCAFDVCSFFCFDTRGHCGWSRGLTGYNRPPGAARLQQEEGQEPHTRALKWQRFIFMQRSHNMYSSCGDNRVLSGGWTSSSGRHVGGLQPVHISSRQAAQR